MLSSPCVRMIKLENEIRFQPKNLQTACKQPGRLRSPDMDWLLPTSISTNIPAICHFLFARPGNRWQISAVSRHCNVIARALCYHTMCRVRGVFPAEIFSTQSALHLARTLSHLFWALVINMKLKAAEHCTSMIGNNILWTGVFLVYWACTHILH